VRRTQHLALLDRNEVRWLGDRRAIAVLAGAVFVRARRLGAGSCDVERHHPVAGQLASGGWLLRNHEANHVLRVTEGTFKSRPLPGASDLLGRLTRCSADVVRYRLAAGSRRRMARPAAVDHTLGYLAGLGHRRY